MSWCSDAPEDEAISLFAGLLANPDMTLSPYTLGCVGNGGARGNGTPKDRDEVKRREV